jgi:hypothetical protein
MLDMDESEDMIWGNTIMQSCLNSLCLCGWSCAAHPLRAAGLQQLHRCFLSRTHEFDCTHSKTYLPQCLFFSTLGLCVLCILAGARGFTQLGLISRISRIAMLLNVPGLTSPAEPAVAPCPVSTLMLMASLWLRYACRFPAYVQAGHISKPGKLLYFRVAHTRQPASTPDQHAVTSTIAIYQPVPRHVLTTV